MSEDKTKAVDVVAAIEVATSVDAINDIIKDDDRKTVQEAATKRIAQLEDVDAPAVTEEDKQEQRNAKKAKAEKARVKFLKSQEGYEYKGKKYVFKDHTPGTLSFKGAVHTLADLVKDNDAMDELISGGSGFIKFKR